MSSIDGVKIPAGLVLPSGAQPKFVCEICGAHFWEQEHHVRHITRCVRKNRESIEALVEQRRRDPLEQATDWEAVEFQRKKYAHLLGR
jgi:hypothetical protein